MTSNTGQDTARASRRAEILRLAEEACAKQRAVMADPTKREQLITQHEARYKMPPNIDKRIFR